MLERLPPFWMQGAEPGYWLGTDSLGRDLLSRLIYGGRIAFIVAFAAAIAACLVGSTLGLIAGYFGGWADRIISRIVDIWMAFPPVLFAILLVAVLGTGLQLGHHRHRRHRLDALLPRGARRGDEPVRAWTMSRTPASPASAASASCCAKCCPTCCRRSSRCCRWRWASRSSSRRSCPSSICRSPPTIRPGAASSPRAALSIHQAWWVLVFPLIMLFLTVLSFSQFGEGLKARFDPVLR